MAEDTSKWIEAIAKLTKLTQDGELTWSSAPSSSVLTNDEAQQIESVFTAKYKNKKLRIYKKRFKVEVPDPTFSAITVTWPFARKYPYWTAQIYLEIIDEYYDQSLWTFPEVSALRDLWTSVKYQASGVKDLLDDLLQDEESS